MTLFIVLWLIASLVIGLFGLILFFDGKKLPPWLTVIYKYGKLLRDLNNDERSVSGLLLIRWIQVPKRYFSHFYGIAVILHLIVLLSSLFHVDSVRQILNTPLNLLFGAYKYDGVNVYLFFLLSMIHIFRRFIESVFIAVPSFAKINLIHYLTGIGFYISIALYNANNLFSTVLITQDRPYLYTVGLIFYVIGQVLQFHSHKILSELRRRNDKPRGKAGYYLPHGGLFEFVSCPNYFSELVIYSGLYMLTNLNANWLAILIWVYSNQVVASLLNHKWYKQAFGSRYPARRKAIIPYIL